MRRKYTDEAIESAVKSSANLLEAIRKLGAPEGSGGVYSHIRSRVLGMALDRSHFRRTPPPSRHTYRTPDSILIKRSQGPRTRTGLLRRALIEIGVTYRCSSCARLPEWEGKPLVLEVDHINRDRFDDRRENLRFMCPNCHSQA